jgi:F-type H+-transporting ATPase subunit epsilon
MQVEILTPDKTLFTGTAEIITFPGTGGSFQVKENHAAMISSLVKGILEVQSANETVKFEINGGLVEVLSNKVVVLV